MWSVLLWNFKINLQMTKNQERISELLVEYDEIGRLFS